jgi:hypothetical protein
MNSAVLNRFCLPVGKAEDTTSTASDAVPHRQLQRNNIFLVSALPRISLLLLFNDGEEEFPAKCSVLFQRHAEYYLDPESLAMTSACLARELKIKVSL